jgi:hypothetical protein
MFHERLFPFHHSKVHGMLESQLSDIVHVKRSLIAPYMHTQIRENDSRSSKWEVLGLHTLQVGRIPTQQQSHHLLSMIYVSFVSIRHIQRPFIARHPEEQSAMRGS